MMCLVSTINHTFLSIDINIVDSMLLDCESILVSNVLYVNLYCVL
jgi:hypothetical protein